MPDLISILSKEFWFLELVVPLKRACDFLFIFFFYDGIRRERGWKIGHKLLAAFFLKSRYVHLLICIQKLSIHEKRKPGNWIVYFQQLINESSNPLFCYWQYFFLCLQYGFPCVLESQPGLKFSWVISYTSSLSYVYCGPVTTFFQKGFRTRFLSKESLIKIFLDPFLRNFFSLSCISCRNS